MRSLVIVVVAVLIGSIFCQDFDDYSSGSDDSLSNSTVNGTDYEEDNDDQRCSADAIIDQLNAIILPEDYEDGKRNIKDHFESFNDTFKSMLRLQEYQRNVSAKMSELNKRISSRLTEVFMTIDLPSECMSSLVRIMTGVQNGDLWALKCKCDRLKTCSMKTNGVVV